MGGQSMTEALSMRKEGTTRRRMACLAIVAGLAAFLALAAIMIGAGTAGAAQFRTDEIEIVTVRGRFRMVVEMAETSKEREQGLQFRQRLGEDRGMLFDFGKTGPVAMWMKNTLIPLDMVFIAEDGHVARVAANTKPLSLEVIPSGGPVRGVLEVEAGTAERMGITKGSLIRHPMFGEVP